MSIEDNNTNPQFGEIASLNELFSEAKKLRKARLPARVLVVEDDPLTRRIVTGSFKEHYAMVSSSTAQEAVEDYLMYAPDIVFLDIGLPDVDGFVALDLIMGIDPDAFVVMFSSNGYPENVEKALKMGAKGFVKKPFKKETMQRYIQGSALHHQKSCA
ncbi:MAG: response regulator [Alphaproteobacteria bacterium]|nr:response regulator [Alphaproteobacteria bacterium]